MKLSSIGERGIIRECIKLIRRIDKFYEFNDVSYLELEGKILTFNIEGYSFTKWKLPFTTWYDCGWRAIAGAISDLVAKLSIPMGISVSLILRRDLDLEDLKDLMRGIIDFSQSYNIKILKFDTNEGTEDSITVSALGIAHREIPLRCSRKGYIFTRPLFGYTGIVFELYHRNMLSDYINDDIVKMGIRIVRRPEPDFEILRELYYYSDRIISSSDVSDGLGATLWNIAELSNCEVVIHELPTGRDVLEFCKNLGIDYMKVVFNGGEEYVPIFVTDDPELKHVLEGKGYTCIGTIEPSSSPRVVYGNEIVRYSGWEYFRNYT